MGTYRVDKAKGKGNGREGGHQAPQTERTAPDAAHMCMHEMQGDHRIKMGDRLRDSSQPQGRKDYVNCTCFKHFWLYLVAMGQCAKPVVEGDYLRR